MSAHPRSRTRVFCDGPLSDAVCGWSKLVRLAQEVANGSTEPSAVLTALGVRVVTRALAAAAGGHQAELVLGSSGAVIIVDPECTPAERLTTWPLLGPDIANAAVFNARLAHELAHLVLHRADDGSVRRRFAWTPFEEDYCDNFAAALLCGSAVPPPDPRSIASFSRQRRIDLDLVARACALQHGVHVSFGSYDPGQVSKLRWSRNHGPRMVNSDAIWLHERVGVPAGPYQPRGVGNLRGFVAVVGATGRRLFASAPEVIAA